MNRKRWLVALVALALASLACQTLLGGGTPTPVSPSSNGNEVQPSAPTVAPDNSGNQASEFPMPNDVTNKIEVGDTLIFQTKLSLKDAMAFYRDAFGKEGLTERTALTVTSGTTFNMVFDGDPSGKAIVVQGVDLGGGVTNITITRQDV